MLVRSIRSPGIALLLAAAAVIIISGCTTKHYRRSADREVYGIINQVEARLFGTNSGFTINTSYSGRDADKITSLEVLDGRTSTNRRSIDLTEAIQIAYANSREYQRQKETLYLAGLSLTGARRAFRPIFSAGGDASFTGTKANGIESSTVGTQIGVSQLLDTGGTLGAALANDILSFYTGNQPREIRSIFTVNIAQPLLRGFGAADPRVEALTQAERDVLYAVRNFQLDQQEFVVGVVNEYFALLTLKDIVRNNYRNYTNRLETTRFLEARAVDRERRSSVDDARNSELTARRSYIDSLASFLNNLDTFKLRLGIPVSERLYLEDQDLKALIEKGLIPVEISPAAAFQLALQSQMEILNAVDRFEDSRRRIRVAASQLKMDVDISGNASLASTGIDDYTTFDVERLRYSAGVRVDLPIDRLLERNAYRRALINFETEIRNFSLTLDTYRNRIDRGLRTLEQARLNYLNRLEAVRVAERRVENTRLLMEAGRATVRDVREAQDSLIGAQNELSALYASYLNSRLSLLLDIGSLDTQMPQFWLQDHLQNLGPAQRGAPPLRMPDDFVLPPERFIEPET